jgi:hypothetical protein
VTNVYVAWEVPMTNRFTCIAFAAILFGLAAAPAEAGGGKPDDDDAPKPSALAPLTGENLLGSELGTPGTSTVSGTCNPLGTSTFTFTVTGEAFGPYPGTFTETGSITLGPFGTGPFAATSFESTFTINSTAGTVTGSKTLTAVGAPTSLGLCGTAAFPTGGANSLHFDGTLSYSASITTPTGSGTDSGESHVTLQDTQIRGQADFNGFNFVESYTSTSAAPGGECEEDDQGDCDDQGEDEDD